MKKNNKIKKIKLDAYEQELEDADLKLVSDAESIKIKNILSKANKTHNINIRLSEHDLEKIKERSVIEGLPYQTLISSVLHKYITNKLIDDESILRASLLMKN
jgi:predicted DNA binding CopG/RHH family protein